MNIYRFVRIFAAAILCAGTTWADAIPQVVDLPSQLSLGRALAIVRNLSADVLIAQAQVSSSEGDVAMAGAMANPVFTGGYGRVLPPYDPSNCGGSGCSANQYAVGLADQAAIEDSLSGKRSLRLRVAKAARAAAGLSREDALRTVEFRLKSAYVQMAQAQRALTFARQVQKSNVETLTLFKTRFRSGAINEGDVARIETQKLESDQAVDQAISGIEQARASLAFILGVRGLVGDWSVDESVLDYRTSESLTGGSIEHWLRSAFEHRPDLLAQGYQRASAEAAVELAKRQRMPDIALSVQYTQTGSGQNAIQPPTLSFGMSLPIPVFYQQQGEIRKAEAQSDVQSLMHVKTTAQVVNDVSTAVVGLRAAKSLVERMEASLKPAAERSLQITRTQYEKGAASLMDMLDAQRTYIATNVEYLQDLANYWTSVFQLEQAVGVELYR